MRNKRKLEHLHLALKPDGPRFPHGLSDLRLVNNSLPELNLDEIDLRTSFLGKQLRYPIIINAMTGGVEEALDINLDLAQAARETGVALAVGSQTIALHESALARSFRVVRRANPEGVILANVGAGTRADDALRAVEMVEADGIQVHLNIPQELAMKEGDRCFRGVLDSLGELVARSPVPVVAKEVGFGLSREVCRLLFETGIRCFDCGGQGGTNFVAIENRRDGSLGDSFAEWGIPTAASVAEMKSLDLPIHITASGGISNGLEAAKVIALGAGLAGMAGHLLRVRFRAGKTGLVREIEHIAYQMRCAALLTGSGDIASLQKTPMVITGFTASWLAARGIDVTRWANR